MKYRVLIFFRAGIVFSLALFAACGNASIPSSCLPALPELPGHWKEILGEASWRLEWVSEEGIWAEWEGRPGEKPPELSLMEEWTTPLVVWPFWPERGLLPGMMRPAGALYPWDLSGEKLLVSWKAGVDAFFWKSLAAAESPGGAERFPWRFDWPRFRELLENGNIPGSVRLDPWLADWKTIARNTARSGFSSRLVAARPLAELAIPDPGGLWAGSSPFAPLLVTPAESPLRLGVTDTPDTWVSSRGLIRASASGWVFRGNAN